MPFCGACGAKVPDDARFCPKCGTPSHTDVETQPQEGIPGGPPAYASQPLSSSAVPSSSSAPPPVKPKPALASRPSPPLPDSKRPPSATGAALAPSVGTERKAHRRPPPEKKTEEVSPIIQALKQLYREKILPIEQAYKFPDFHSASLTETDFDAKPMVLLVGQYSTGKTSFIRYLVERDFPGANIGPEPTTDRFVSLMWGAQDRIVPGNAAAVAMDKPFRGLQRFGMNFLNKFEVAECAAPLLEKITFIDSPGVLSGEKQRLGRQYDFPQIIEWFAERADRILLLFDAHKLDISDEFKSAIEKLKGHDDKIRCVLNKADMVDRQQLMRVYGALMWSLGKVIQTPEVLRVYLGSFWDKPLQRQDFKSLLEAEQADLLTDLRTLPRNSTVRKINELVKRARMAKTHAYIIGHLRAQFGFFGKEKLQKKLLNGLLEEFKAVQGKYRLPAGDFPNVGRFRELLSKHNIADFPKMDKSMRAKMDIMEQALSVDLPRLMKLLPNYDESSDAKEFVAGSILNPFAKDINGMPAGGQWSIDLTTKKKYDADFYALPLSQNKLPGSAAKEFLQRTGLDSKVLRAIWALGDMDQDGQLDSDEFAVVMHIINEFKAGNLDSVPSELPFELIPPSKRHLFQEE